jgi:hypothetical protein
VTPATWTADELDRIAAAEELEIAVLRPGGKVGKAVPIWVVRVGDELYVRSWRGPSGGWYRAAQATRAGHIRAAGIERDVALTDADQDVNDAVDAALRSKYGRYGSSYVTPMTQPPARGTTLKLTPRAAGGASA